ncbi:guanitoxin biosynthesis MATE family efflux transporter GntT [Nostoc sp. 2RC]|uniref:guanitoxin biosynthesis MATE family efflux transporter GntT n=1 Tax=Nostoc sp. 2RC TaxID=2485484 RepID=UPI0016247BEF|nr:guanitoxin biosynthesis MATE family efflux transporter GntT [Nostoc sp. 2RC]MBC1237313.1 MATE family efflux transporter [Nostoc sp. 2RC]
MNLTLSEQYEFVPRFFSLAIANILSNLMIPLAGLISVAFLGHLKEIDALAGVSIANILFGLVYLILEFLRMGTTGLTAQAVGADDGEAVLLVGLRNGLIGLVLGIAVVALQYPLREIGFSVLSGDVAIKAAGIEYYNARIWGAPAVLLNFVLIGWLLGREENGKVLILSAIGNAANIVLDYIFIIQWGWNSTGAGASQASSQYLMLFIGIILASQKVQWQEIRAVSPQIMDLSALKNTLSLNRDIMLRTITEVSVFAFFSNLSAMMGTIIFTQNSLLGQIAQLNVYLTNGLGFATETLSGNFKGSESKGKFLPLLRVSVASSLFIGLSIATICIFFPQPLFGILTNHTEITANIDNYIWCLCFILAFNSVASMFEGYFLGLAEGKIVRNVSFIATFFGFVPSAIAGWYFQNNYILWLSIILFMFAKMLTMLVYLPKSLSFDTEVDSPSLTAVEN